MLRAAIIALVALTSCAPQSGSLNSKLGIKDWSSVKMRLVRGMCYGACPFYGVEIRGDGSVEFCGFAYVREIGERTRKIPRADVRALADVFASANFLKLDAEYVDGPTDGAMYSVELSFDAEAKHVRHYSGSDRGRALLGTLEEAIDRTARVNEWVGGRSDRSKEPAIIPACASGFGIYPPQPMPLAPL